MMSFRVLLVSLWAISLAKFVAADQTHDIGARLDKAPARDNLDHLTPGLETHLNGSDFRYTEWKYGFAPKDCYRNALDNGVNTSELEVYNVYYQDCTDPWIICHHPASGVTPDSLFQQFGQLPVQMRRWVRHLIAIPYIPDVSPFAAYEENGNIVTRLNSDHMLAVLVHETAHSMDLNGAYGIGESSLSASHVWWDEGYGPDTMVPDRYAQSNMMENVAQCHIVALFNLHVPGGIPAIEPQSDHILHQYNTLLKMESRAVGNGTRFLKYTKGAQCTQRLNNSKPVFAANGSSLPANGLPVPGQPLMDNQLGVNLSPYIQTIRIPTNRPARISCPLGLDLSNF